MSRTGTFAPIIEVVFSPEKDSQRDVAYRDIHSSTRRKSTAHLQKAVCFTCIDPVYIFKLPASCQQDKTRTGSIWVALKSSTTRYDRYVLHMKRHLRES